jgi:hypothetical protein
MAMANIKRLNVVSALRLRRCAACSVSRAAAFTIGNRANLRRAPSRTRCLSSASKLSTRRMIGSTVRPKIHAALRDVDIVDHDPR